jgi:hypothetical protein
MLEAGSSFGIIGKDQVICWEDHLKETTWKETTWKEMGGTSSSTPRKWGVPHPSWGVPHPPLPGNGGYLILQSEKEITE